MSSDAVRIRWRIGHIRRAISDIQALLQGRSLAETARDVVARAAFERFLEIVSEASRHLPESMKEEVAPEIPWKKIADLGNRLRHAYQAVDIDLLWSIYEHDLEALELALDRLDTALG